MSPIDLLWHALNFISPACASAVFAAWMAKTIWRRELKSTPLVRLAAWSGGAAALGYAAGAFAFGRDGAMAAYASMVLAAALALWGVLLRARRA